MFAFRALIYTSRPQWRQISTNLALKSQTATTNAADRMTIPPPDGVERPPNPKLDKIVTDIAALNLLEVSELSSLLKKRLNLPDAPMMPAFGAMQMAAPAKTDEDEEEAAPKAVKTSFKVKLMKFDEKQKVALIKEVKNLMEGMNLVQAKKFVESAPTLVKDECSKEEAEKLKEAFTKVGAVIEVE